MKKFNAIIREVKQTQQKINEVEEKKCSYCNNQAKYEVKMM